MTTLVTHLQVRRATTAEWAAPTRGPLLEGEIGLDTDTSVIKMGIGLSWADTTDAIPSVDLDMGHLVTTGQTGDYTASVAGICSITGDIDVRWKGDGLSFAGTGNFRSIVDVAGAFDFRCLGSNGRLAINVQNGVANAVANVGAVAVPVADGYRVTWVAATGAATFEVLDAAGAVVTVDGDHWTVLAVAAAPVTGNQLTAGAKVVSVGGLSGNGTEANALHTTGVQIFDGIDGTLVVDVDFTGKNQLNGLFEDADANTWKTFGNSYFKYVSGVLNQNGDVIDMASIVDIAKLVGGWGSNQVNPLTGTYLPENFGDPDIDPASWTVAQRGAATRAALSAAVAAIDRGNKRGQTLSLGGGVWEIDAYTGLADPVNPSQPYCALPSWDYLTIEGVGWDATTILLTAGANCHVIGHPGRTQVGDGVNPPSGQQDQIFNFSVRNLTIDGNRSGQDGAGTHDGLRISQHPGYRLENVHIINCDGKPHYTTANGDFFVAPATSPGVNIVRPTTMKNVICEGNAQGIFLSATNRDTDYQGVHSYGNGSPQARIVGKTIATNIAGLGGGGTGLLKLLIDQNAEVDITLANGDTPAGVVVKINAALGAATAIGTTCSVNRYRLSTHDGLPAFDGAGNLNYAGLAATAADVGQLLISPLVPRGTKILAYVSPTHVTLTNPGTAGTADIEVGTNIIAFPNALNGWVGGKVSGIGIPSGSLVGAVTNSGTINATITIVDGGGLPLAPRQPFPKGNGIVTINGVGQASLTPSGRLIIKSDTTGGIGQVYLVGTSAAAILTCLGLTTAPNNGDNNYRSGACEYPGIFLDHSECVARGLFSDSNYGDNFYIHNVDGCDYSGLHSTRASGYGIYADALTHSTGSGWVAMMNCQDFGVASYRAATVKAEVYFDNGTEGYGITKDTTIYGINGPGAKDQIGNDLDNRFADWSVYVADNVVLTVGQDAPIPTSLHITKINPGDGGIQGVLRPPAAYISTAPNPTTPAGIAAPGRYDPVSHVYTPVGGQTLVKLPAKLSQSRQGVGRTKIAFLGPSNVAGWNGTSSLRGLSDYPFQLGDHLHAAGYDCGEPLFTFLDAVAGDNRISSLTGSWNYSPHPAIDVVLVGSGGATMTVKCTRWGDCVEISVLGTSASFTVAIDGVNITTTGGFTTAITHGAFTAPGFITADGTANFCKFTVSALPLAAHVVTISCVGSVSPTWIDCYNSKGVSTANFGSSGTRTADWDDTSLYYTLLNEVIAWGPDAVVFDTAMQFNSWQNGESFATSLANMTTAVNALKSAGIEVFLTGSGPGISPVTGTPPTGFWQNLFQLADAVGCQYLEQFTAWGSSEATALANGLMGGADTVHPSASGYTSIARSIAQAWGIVPFKRLLPLRVNDAVLTSAPVSYLQPNVMQPVSSTAASFAIAFPPAPRDGTLMGVKNQGTANLVTITASGTDTITGQAAVVHGCSELWIYYAPGTTWLHLADATPPSTDVWAASTFYTAGQIVTLSTGGRAFRTADGTSLTTWALERAANVWTFIPGGHYEKLVASGNWLCPTGITHARGELGGAGGGGAGGTSTVTINAQIGSSGGAAGNRFVFDEVNLVAGTNYAYLHGTGGPGGAGSAAGGNIGSNGTDGGDGVFTGVTTTKTAKGGGKGYAPAVNATGAVGGGIMGWPAVQNAATAFAPGCGGSSGVGAMACGNLYGGAGSGVCNATNGGAGGTAATALGQIVGNPGLSGTINGTPGTTATIECCGGGAGGPGNKTGGTGAAGGAGADGFLKMWF